jgi:hypothetical protein
LSDACKVAQLIVNTAFDQTGLLKTLLEASLAGLNAYAKNDPLKLPADYRLAFRELGLSIGLHAAEKLQELIEKNPDRFNKKHPLHSALKALRRYAPLGETIEMFWLERSNREVDSWRDHRDINMAMLATSLAPDGYLTL